MIRIPTFNLFSLNVEGQMELYVKDGNLVIAELKTRKKSIRLFGKDIYAKTTTIETTIELPVEEVRAALNGEFIHQKMPPYTSKTKWFLGSGIDDDDEADNEGK